MRMMSSFVIGRCRAAFTGRQPHGGLEANHACSLEEARSAGDLGSERGFPYHMAVRRTGPPPLA
jgi:hypothetical protein